METHATRIGASHSTHRRIMALSDQRQCKYGCPGGQPLVCSCGIEGWECDRLPCVGGCRRAASRAIRFGGAESLRSTCWPCHNRCH